MARTEVRSFLTDTNFKHATRSLLGKLTTQGPIPTENTWPKLADGIYFAIKKAAIIPVEERHQEVCANFVTEYMREKKVNAFLIERVNNILDIQTYRMTTREQLPSEELWPKLATGILKKIKSSAENNMCTLLESKSDFVEEVVAIYLKEKIKVFTPKDAPKEQPAVADTTNYQTEMSGSSNVEAKSSGESSSAQKEQPVVADTPNYQREMSGSSNVEAKSSGESS